MDNSIIDRRDAEYSPLIDSFKSKLNNLNVEGLTGPHLPGVGECYAESKYKFAFCGWETYGWHSMSDFMNMEPNEYLKLTDSSLNNCEHLGWASNWHATYWAFVLKFLARFYNIPFKNLFIADKSETEIISILKSFVWGNTNSIERYEVSSKYEGGNPDVWSIAKQASKAFDDINHIINSCMPNVVFVVHSGASKDYFLNNSSLSEKFGVDITRKDNVLHLQNERMKYDYFYLRNSETHLFKLPHPTWMGLYSGIGIDTYVKSIYEDIRNYHIWDTLPDSPKERISSLPPATNKSSRENKFHVIAALAHSLTQNELVMSGKEIQELFNRNEITTQYGTPYGDNGGRGIHKLISSAWNYYQQNGDFQTAYDIARAFVNQNGEYAY